MSSFRGYFASWSFALAMAFAIAFAAAGEAFARKPKAETTIKFATLAPEGSTWMKVLRQLDDEVRAQTENRVGFKFYPGGVQGDEMDVLRKVRNGQLHAGGFTGFGLGAVASEFRAIEVPFMFRNLEEVDYVRDRFDEHYKKVFEEKGYLLLGWADVGFIYLYSNQPIQSVEQLRAGKVWTWSGDKLAELFFKAFQVTPIPLALPDVLTSLQMGLVNAVYAPPLACIALQWFTRVKYMTDIPITYGFGAMIVSTKAVKGVSPEDMEILKTLAAKHSRRLIDKTRVKNVEAIEEIRREGVDVLSVTPEVYQQFFTVGKSAWRDGVGTLYPQELLDRVSAAVEEYRQNNE